MVDGSIKHAQTEGSIHKVAATILGAESCNGWTYWHCKIGSSIVPIDNLRQKFLHKIVQKMALNSHIQKLCEDSLDGLFSKENWEKMQRTK